MLGHYRPGTSSRPGAAMPVFWLLKVRRMKDGKVILSWDIDSIAAMSRASFGFDAEVNGPRRPPRIYRTVEREFLIRRVELKGVIEGFGAPHVEA
jgi:hypothetical protein